jgi:hypothetical protein
VYDYAYASRGNVVHAYDVIPQPDTATRSGNVTLSVADILSVLECFFRVNRALKVLEPYIPYELATASAVPAVYADDLSIIYDLGASINAIKTVYAFDKLATDYATYTKSYSPLFFSLFQRRVPVVYKTLSVLDVVAVKDSLSTVVVKTVPASDYIGFDSVTYAKSYSPLFFTLLRRKIPIVYKTLGVLDIVAVRDSASVVPIKVVSVLDVVPVADRVDVKNIAISVSDFIMYDYVPSMSPSSIRYRSLYANVGMRTISVFDRITPYESVWVGPRVMTVNVFDRITPYESVWVGPRVITVNARDYLVSDGATIVKRSVHAYDVVVVWENVNIVRL